MSRKRSHTLQIHKGRYLKIDLTVKLPQSQTEGETVNKTLEEPADAVDARVRLLLLQVSMKLVQLGHQDLTNTVS